MIINDHSCSFDLKLETVTIAQLFPGWELLEAARNWINIGHGSKLYHLSMIYQPPKWIFYLC